LVKEEGVDVPQQFDGVQRDAEGFGHGKATFTRMISGAFCSPTDLPDDVQANGFTSLPAKAGKRDS
jgi:hypothetical protein